MIIETQLSVILIFIAGLISLLLRIEKQLIQISIDNCNASEQLKIENSLLRILNTHLFKLSQNSELIVPLLDIFAKRSELISCQIENIILQQYGGRNGRKPTTSG